MSTERSPEEQVLEALEGPDRLGLKTLETLLKRTELTKFQLINILSSLAAQDVIDVVPLARPGDYGYRIAMAADEDYVEDAESDWGIHNDESDGDDWKPPVDNRPTHKKIGFLDLTTKEGSALWLVAGTVWAIEKSPNESFTMIKTAAEPIAVIESPQDVIDQLAEIFLGPQEPVTDEVSHD